MVLEGRDSDVTRALERDMQQAAGQLDFERAATAARPAGEPAQAAGRAGRSIPATSATWTPSPSWVSPATTPCACCWCAAGAASAPPAIFRARRARRKRCWPRSSCSTTRARKPPPEVRVNLDLPDAVALSEALSLQQAGSRGRVASGARHRRRAGWTAREDNARQALRMRQARRADAAELLRGAARGACSWNRLPQRIECFDISHTGGEGTVASCVVFTTEGAARKEYRRFNIETAEGGDDYGALREAVGRRFTRIARGRIPGSRCAADRWRRRPGECRAAGARRAGLRIAAGGGRFEGPGSQARPGKAARCRQAQRTCPVRRIRRRCA